jgi:hypothetical protein
MAAQPIVRPQPQNIFASRAGVPAGPVARPVAGGPFSPPVNPGGPMRPVAGNPFGGAAPVGPVARPVGPMPYQPQPMPVGTPAAPVAGALPNGAVDPRVGVQNALAQRLGYA